MHEDEQFERLGKAIKGLSRQEVFVPASIDEAVTAAARKRLGPGGAKRKGVIGKPGKRKVSVYHRWLPLAASLLISGTILYTAWEFRQGRSIAHDINQDGVVDVRDALLLARRIDAGEGGRDFNRDGVLDRRDAEEIVNGIVALKEGDAS